MLEEDGALADDGRGSRWRPRPGRPPPLVDQRAKKDKKTWHYKCGGRLAVPGDLSLPSEALQAAVNSLMLVDSITGTIDWARYQDDTAEKLSALIEAKIAGQPCAIPAEEPVQVFQLLDALKQSVAAATENGKPKSSKRGQTSRRRSA